MKKSSSRLFVLMTTLISLLGIYSNSQAAPDVIYVDLDAAGANDGSSWGDAFTDLQSALSVAVPGDDLWVAEGVYKPGTDRTASFQLLNGVGFFGGFSGAETSRDERDWAAHPTILSGDVGATGDSADNSYHVVTASGTDASAVLDGFTITGGNANVSTWIYHQGGGMYSSGGSPTLANVTFSSNNAIQGGGMFNSGGSPTLNEVFFSGNTGGSGGGMLNHAAHPTLNNVTFSSNSSNWGGGMLNLNASNPTLINVIFSGNSVSGSAGGGGMSNAEGSSPTLLNVTFSANNASRGGGMVNEVNCNSTLTNVIFIGNTATALGGGMVNITASPTLTNVTFYANSAVDGGAVRNTQNSNPTIANAILWGNPAVNQISNDLVSTVDITYSIIQGGYAGEGNLDLDPAFVDAASGDLHLEPSSPAINVGDNSALPADALDLDGDTDTTEPIPYDLDGNPRIRFGIVDLGAFESEDFLSSALTVTSLNDPGDGVCDPMDCTLREAIVAIAPGGTIEFDASLSGGTITLASQLNIDKDMTIDGSSLTSHVIISGDDSVRVFDIYPGITVMLRGLDIVHGLADYGGGIHNSGTLTLAESIFSTNSVTDSGGGIYHDGGTLAVIDSIFSDNSAPFGEGGAIISFTTSTVTDSVFSSNHAIQGGGINNYNGNLTVTNSTFSNNSSDYAGGIRTRGELIVTNSTFSGNSAYYEGGGIYLNGTLTVTNSTFSGNSAYPGDTGGGIRNWGGTLNLINTILANSPTGGDCSNGGVIGTDIHNLIEENSGCGTPISSNDPGLGPLQDNGGPTHTMAIDHTSPAFDAGDNASCPATDQRGVPRPLSTECDIGAYEANPAPFVSDDSATMLKDTPIIIDVLANDTGTGGPLSVESTSQPIYGSVTVNTDETLTYTPQPNFYGIDSFTYTAIDNMGGTGTATVALVPAIRNDAWTRAYPLSNGEVLEQPLQRAYQSRWFRFDVPPGSEITVTLTGLPANYDLTLYTDIAASYRDLQSPQDLMLLSAEFAPDMFSPDMFSPDMFSPDMFSPDMFSPDMFSPDMFSPDMFSPDMFSPDMFSPDMFSPDMFSPDMFSPDMFSPDMFSPDMFSPDMFSPDMFSPDMFSPDPATFASAVLRSMIAVSAQEGTAAEGLRLNSWNRSGPFYVRVTGRNGAFDPEALFHLEVTVNAGVCADVDPALPPSSITGVNGNYQTIVIGDLDRMTGTTEEITALEASIAAFIGRSEVGGVWVNVDSDARVEAANALADAHPECPYAKNLVAEAIQGIIESYRDAGNPLEYVVIIGNDDVIPFFRYPDNALLANEMNYSPPVLEGTSSQASLQLGYVLGQDEYGSQINLVQGGSLIPLPDLAVGRLVETPVEVIHMLDVYAATQDGVLETPDTALVTGYDFLADAAVAIESELQAGLGGPVESLITDRFVAPQLVCPSESTFDGQCSWTADQMATALFGSRHDIIFLAGHFTASSWLAPDNQSRLVTSDLEGSGIDLENALIISAGCHSGYNIVNEHNVLGVTREPDWAQAFAREGATFIGGTGYQYGDTDFVEYSERLYLEFSQQLRMGTGPVSIGQALVDAKLAYLIDTAQMGGIHVKSLLQATLFGLPMLSVDLPYGRTTPPTDPSIVSTTTSFADNPGSTLGLSYADVVIEPDLTTVYVPLNQLLPDPEEAVYLSGRDGEVSNPTQPVLPLEMYNVSVVDSVLRGIGFRGGTYIDLENVLPLTGAPATEIRGVHTPFFTNYFYPVRPWNVNYFAALTETQGGMTRLAVLPAQYRSSDPLSITGTLRQYEDMAFRLYYSTSTESYSNYEYVPAQAAPPLIADISATNPPDTSTVNFQVTVVGDPTAGIQEVWIVYTIEDGLLGGEWLALDLIQEQGDGADTRLWKGSLTLPSGISPADIRYMVQAVNGVGLVSYATNLGAYYTPGDDPGAPPPATQEPSELTLQSPTIGAYSESITASATLTSNGNPVSGEIVVFRLGAQSRLAMTNPEGYANAAFLLLGLTGDAALSVSLPGSEDYASSTATSSFTITKQTTQLSITLLTPMMLLGEDAVFAATLTDVGERRLPGMTVLFEVRETGSPVLAYSEAVATDYTGQARFILPVPPTGEYTVSAQFGGAGISDPRYFASSSEVLIFDFSGFFRPVDNPPIVNRVNAGRAIPIKFSLNGDHGLEILDGSPRIITISCETWAPINDLTETVTAGSSSLSYDASEDQYIYVWKTAKSWAGTCLQLVLTLVDGTEHTANFQFR